MARTERAVDGANVPLLEAARVVSGTLCNYLNQSWSLAALLHGWDSIDLGTKTADFETRGRTSWGTSVPVETVSSLA